MSPGTPWHDFRFLPVLASGLRTIPLTHSLEHKKQPRAEVLVRDGSACTPVRKYVRRSPFESARFLATLGRWKRVVNSLGSAGRPPSHATFSSTMSLPVDSFESDRGEGGLPKAEGKREGCRVSLSAVLGILRPDC